MLVISRKPGEIIRIGDDIEIMLIGTAGCRAKIGVSAPRSMRIDRVSALIDDGDDDDEGEEDDFERSYADRGGEG